MTAKSSVLFCMFTASDKRLMDALDAMVIGLHQMKKNLSSSGRAAEASV